MLKLFLIWWIMVVYVLCRFSPFHLSCQVCACRVVCCVDSVLVSAGSVIVPSFIPNLCLLLFSSSASPQIYQFSGFFQGSTFISPSLFFLFLFSVSFIPCLWFLSLYLCRVYLFFFSSMLRMMFKIINGRLSPFQ